MSRACLNAMMAVTMVQVALGISALLYHVPVSLGSLHQANALTLFTFVVGLLHTLRVPPTVAAVAAGAGSAAAGGGLGLGALGSGVAGVSGGMATGAVAGAALIGVGGLAGLASTSLGVPARGGGTGERQQTFGKMRDVLPKSR